MAESQIAKNMVAFLIGTVISYFALFIIAVLKDFASWTQIILPSMFFGVIISVWKDKFVKIFLEILSWF